MERGFTLGSDGKDSSAVKETLVQSLGWEDALGKGMATHSSILAWRIPWTEEPSGLQSVGSQRVRHNQATNTIKLFPVDKCWHKLLVAYLE